MNRPQVRWLTQTVGEWGAAFALLRKRTGKHAGTGKCSSRSGVYSCLYSVSGRQKASAVSTLPTQYPAQAWMIWRERSHSTSSGSLSGSV